MSALKHAHMLFAVISVTLFTIRFMLLMKRPESLNNKFLKVFPHIVDTLLFILGIAMMIKLSLYPTTVPWMAEKLLAVLAYIYTGYFTLKKARTNAMRWFGFFASLGWMVLIARIAMTKTNYLF